MSFIDRAGEAVGRAANAVGNALGQGANWVAEQAETPETKILRLQGLKNAQLLKCLSVAAMVVSLSLVLFGLIAWSFLGAILIIIGAVATLLLHDGYRASSNMEAITSSAITTAQLGLYATRINPTESEIADKSMRVKKEVLKGTIILGTFCGIYTK